MIENPGTFQGKDSAGVMQTWTGGAGNYDGSADQAIAFATKYDIIPNANDPTSKWLVSQPVNNKEAKLYGAEFAAQHFFGDSGFGLQANYTIVRGDISYDNAGDPSISQFALLGLSDTANLVGIYEKDGLQARVAYNWRGEFLRSASQGSYRNPVYTESYSQIDANVSYEINENLTVSLEGLNLTGEDRRDHGRTYEMVEYMIDLGPRYALGARYTF
jgi:TonB-dependent receptor